MMGRGGGKKLSYPGREGWTPQSTHTKNWIIFEKKEITQYFFKYKLSDIFLIQWKKKVLKNPDVKPLKIADVSKKN